MRRSPCHFDQLSVISTSVEKSPQSMNDKLFDKYNHIIAMIVNMINQLKNEHYNYHQVTPSLHC